jgi:phosphatidylglycerol:prolipoprotein diacylglycerol transferase
MCRVALQLGPLTVYSYGLVLVAGFLLVTWLAGHLARSQPPERVAMHPPQIVDVACLSLLGGVLGARSWFVVQHWSVFVERPFEIPAVWHGGLVWYGGLLGGLLAGALYLRARRIPFLQAADQGIPFVALAHGIGRIGCFFNGCCYGIPTTAWFGVMFPGHEGPVIPTQLLEAALLVFLYIGLRRLQDSPVMGRPGRILGAYLASYGVIRFLLEFIRGDQSVLWAGLTLAQLISLGVGPAGLVLWGQTRRPAWGQTPRSR